MKEKLLEILACPECGGDLNLVREVPREKNEIIEGELSCTRCERVYKIERGVPRFAELAGVEKEKAATAENFGWQWTRFTQEDEKYALKPLPPVPSPCRAVLSAVANSFCRVTVAENCYSIPHSSHQPESLFIDMLNASLFAHMTAGSLLITCEVSARNAEIVDPEHLEAIKHLTKRAREKIHRRSAVDVRPRSGPVAAATSLYDLVLAR